MAYVMEGVSLFRATPRLGIIPAGGIIIPASRITGEVPSVGEFPVASEISVPEKVHTQGFVRNEFAADLGAAWKSAAILTVLLVMVHKLRVLVLLRQPHLLMVSTWTT